MGSRGSKVVEEEEPLNWYVGNVGDASISRDISTPEEDALKRKMYANMKSAVTGKKTSSKSGGDSSCPNVIEQVYNEDFDTIDHIQAMRFPTHVARAIKGAVRTESERRCMEKEKAMARCLQDKMWTSWKCQKERDVYYHCVQDEEERNTRPDPNSNDKFVDLMTAYRWKYNLGVFNGELFGRNNLMKSIWKEHFPDRELPQAWVKDE